MSSANQSQYASYKVIFIIMGAFTLCFMLLVMGGKRWIRQNEERERIANVCFTNAVKYNRSGGTIFCKIETEKQERNLVWYICTIQDIGIGMKPEFFVHLFAPFAQEKVDARSVHQGTGVENLRYYGNRKRGI